MKKAPALAALALLAAGCGSSGPHYAIHRNSAHDWTLLSRSKIDELRAALITEAKRDGESHPRDGILVVGGHRCFFKREGLDTGVTYLVAARGHFTLYDASWPPGSGPPTGTHLFFDADARHRNGFSDGGLLSARDHPKNCGPWVSLDLGSN